MKKEENAFVLNERQKEAVGHTEGPLLILAGAGSGKTKVITHRIAHIIEQGIAPQKILAVTFTNKAAEEMKKRIIEFTHVTRYTLHASQPWIGTFHALGAFLLRRESKKIGISKQFSIFDEEDSLSIIKESIKELSLDPKQFQPIRIRSIISRKKGELIDWEMFRNEAEKQYYTDIVGRIWQLYEEKLRAQKAVDFDDLLLLPVRILKENPDVRHTYQTYWSYIHIDEYQDTNHAQYVLANLLAEQHKNICVVGDIDQCVYSWRGADFRNILSFERDWSDARILTLEENYRSSQIILDAANAVIEKNRQRKPKVLFTRKKGGEKISVVISPTEQEEAGTITQTISDLRKKDLPLKNMAVLIRTNFQSRVLEEAFLESNIPYHLTGVKFFNRKEIKDVLSYIRGALNPNDLVSIKRIINIPSRGIGPLLTLKILANKPLSPSEQKKKEAFFSLLENIRTILTLSPPSQAIKTIMRKTGYWAIWDPETEEGAMRIANLKELVTVAMRYDSLPRIEGIEMLLSDAALMSEQDNMKNEKEAVHIMTAHAAKGLEFDYVFLAGLEDGLFPHTTLAGENEEERQEEERRLFYVALTRARKKIFVSFARMRTIFGEKRVNAPSRFLMDIPEHLIETEGENIIKYDQ